MTQFVTGIQERELLATKCEYFLSDYDTLIETLRLRVIEPDELAQDTKSRIYFDSQELCCKFMKDHWQLLSRDAFKWDTGFDGKWFLEY